MTPARSDTAPIGSSEPYTTAVASFAVGVVLLAAVAALALAESRISTPAS